MTYETILLDIASGIATVTLNRPDRMNALNATLHHELEAVCRALRDDDTVRVIIVTGAGRGFCAGADLAGSGSAQYQRDRPWQVTVDEIREPGRNALALYQVDKPSIAAVNGYAVGAGFGIALACDFRIASEEARFKVGFIERNLSPDSGVSYFLPRIVGHADAMDIVLTGRVIEPAEALRMRLVRSVVAPGALLDEARALAERIAAHPPLAAQMSKRAVQRSWEHGFEEQLRYEIRAIDLVRRAVNDTKESGLAFRERRPGIYTGH